MNKYNYFLWDFDGVLINSNPARVHGFKEVLKEYPKDEVKALLEYHEKNGGLSRYVKFRHFFENIRKEAVSDDQVNELAGQFSDIMRDSLTDKNLLIKDSLEFIQRQADKPHHIVSGSDGNELRFLCGELGISEYFRSIEGSPTPKTTLVKNLVESGKVKAAEACLIGDAINDYDAATDNDIDFYGYNNESLKGLGRSYIYSFSKLNKVKS